MERSTQTQEPYTSYDIYDFATGYHTNEHLTPNQVAWMLEKVALDRGWPIGESLGSEADLIDQFDVNRDVIRSAVRLLEARGSMRMWRGRKGGLRLSRPEIDYAASAFATYVRACGCTPADLDLTSSVLAPLLVDVDKKRAIPQLLDRVLSLLLQGPSHSKDTATRAEMVAIQFLERADAPIPEAGLHLGCEAKLCAEFGTGHRTFRQVLSILDDLGMLHVNRGRGGGYLLKRPRPIGLIRRIFALLASRGTQWPDVVPFLWLLNTAKLQIAIRRLRAIGTAERKLWCDKLAATLDGAEEPRRWVTLQKTVARTAGDLILNTMTSGILAYQARTMAPINPALIDHREIEPSMRSAETKVLESLRDLREAEAKHHLRYCHSLLSEVLAAQSRPPSLMSIGAN